MIINKGLLLVLTLLIQQFALGQSPFNYGQNKKVYFISSELRNKLGIQTIYSIDQRPLNDLGGMWENWDVTVISFDSSIVSDDWSPISLDSTYKFNFDSLTDNLNFLNGTRYEFSSGQLISYGGGGYGSFDWKEITRFSDTVSIIATSCVGHCGDQPITYSKNVFNKQRQLLHTVFYPTPKPDNGIDTESDTKTFDDYVDTENDTITFDDYERFFISLIKDADYSADTLFYKYDSNGHLLSDSKEKIISNSLFTYSGNPPAFIFHQCYIGKIKMEKYLLQKIGYVPELVLFEIYNYGVFSFVLKDKKYYPTRTVILER